MTMNVIPGVRQDHEGKSYQIAFLENGEQTRVEIAEVWIPFQIRFLKADGGHLWNFTDKDNISVSSCFRSLGGCKVCSDKRTHSYKVITNA